MASKSEGSAWGLVLGDKPTTNLDLERKLLIQHWGKHPLNWILGEDSVEREIVAGSGIWSKKLIWTSDELDDYAPLKPFPDWEYIQRYIEVLHHEKEVLSDKARQMYITTATLQYINWNNLFIYGRKWIWTKNTKEESEDHLRDKVRRVHERLPMWVQQALPMSATPQDEITYPRTQSRLIAGAENVAIRAARGGTATGFGLDEGAIMDQFATAWAAAAPMCKKLFGLSTPNLGSPGARAYYSMLEREGKALTGKLDRSGDPVTTGDRLPLEAFNVRRSSRGFVIVEVDLEANPEKRSEEFIAELHRRQPNEREFRREYRRDWTVAAGESYYPEWGINGGNGVYVRAAPYCIAGPMFRAWDFGHRSPACIWFQVEPDTDRVYILREMRGQNLNIWEFADLVLVLSGELEVYDCPEETSNSVQRWLDRYTNDPRYPDPPWFQWDGIPPRFVDLGGPEAHRMDDKFDRASKENTDVQVLEGRGITLNVTSAQWNARENVIRKLLRVREDGHPGIIFDPSCRELIEAMGGALCYALPTANNPLPDAPAKNGTHDHLHDALSYGLVQVIDLGEKVMKDGRNMSKVRPAPAPMQSLFHEGRRTLHAQDHAGRSRLRHLYR